MKTESKTEINRYFPEGSKANLADNTDIFDGWLSGETIQSTEWPYIMLCHDKARDKYTWHMLCRDRGDITSLIGEGMKDNIDDHISNERKKRLVGVELISRKGLRHTFL